MTVLYIEDIYSKIYIYNNIFSYNSINLSFKIYSSNIFKNIIIIVIDMDHKLYNNNHCFQIYYFYFFIRHKSILFKRSYLIY